MPDDDDLYYRRQGFWLRMARERAGKSQAGAAQEIGLEAASKSTISGYERGTAIAPQQVLRKLARWYGVSVDLFLHPAPTADELIEQRLDEIGRLAADAEREDWEVGEAPALAADDELGDERRRRSA